MGDTKTEKKVLDDIIFIRGVSWSNTMITMVIKNNWKVETKRLEHLEQKQYYSLPTVCNHTVSWAEAIDSRLPSLCIC